MIHKQYICDICGRAAVNPDSGVAKDFFRLRFGDNFKIGLIRLDDPTASEQIICLGCLKELSDCARNLGITS